MELNDINDPEYTSLDLYLKADTDYNKIALRYDLVDAEYIIIGNKEDIYVIVGCYYNNVYNFGFIVSCLSFVKRKRKKKNLIYYKESLKNNWNQNQ